MQVRKEWGRLHRQVEVAGAVDYVVFNFPHTGATQLPGMVEASVASNRKLLKDIFSNLLKQPFTGAHTKVHITTKGTKYPYSQWEVERMGEDAGWCCVRRYPFPVQHFSNLGYQHQTTRMLRTQVNITGSITYEFVRADL